MSYTRIFFHTLQRSILTSLPLLAMGILNPASAQLHFNQPEAKLETLGLMQSRLADPAGRSAMTPVQWTQYGERISEALAGNHEAIRQSAIRMVVQYGRNLNLKKSAVYDLVRVYRGHDNDRLRRMAVVALAETQDPWAMDFLARSIKYENEPRVRQTLKAVVATYRRGEVEVGAPQTVQN